jgi:hypothetical protein
MAGKDREGGGRWSSDRGRRRGRGRGAGADAYSFGQGEFLTKEHILAKMVIVPPSPGRMLARGIRTMEHLLATMVSLPASPLSVEQAKVIFFYIGF